MFKSIFFFDAMLTPKIIVLLYWVSLVAILLSGIGMMVMDRFLFGLAFIVIGGILCRVSYEMVMIAFKNNEYLKRIAEKP